MQVNWMNPSSTGMNIPQEKKDSWTNTTTSKKTESFAKAVSDTVSLSSDSQALSATSTVVKKPTEAKSGDNQDNSNYKQPQNNNWTQDKWALINLVV